MLQPTQKAPLDTTLLDENNQNTNLGSLLGKYVVVYFYPRDNTPGCTKEACSFRDFNADIQKLGAVVIGVSKDNHESHQKFTEKFDLSFSLWSDPDHKLMKAFGVWQEKKFMGKTYMGTTRSTFVINPKGKIIRVWEKVKPADHAQDVLKYLQSETKP